MSYYFLVASLPLLSLETPPTITSAEFVERCRANLSPVDFAALMEVLEGTETGAADGTQAPAHPFARAWLARSVQLRNAVARVRAAKLDRDATAWLREHKGCDAWIERDVSDAFTKTTPLETEVALDALRWSVLDELKGLDMFSLSAIMGYGLQLRLAERWAALNDTDGERALNAVVDAVMSA